jgi:hypothetical protein
MVPQIVGMTVGASIMSYVMGASIGIVIPLPAPPVQPHRIPINPHAYPHLPGHVWPHMPVFPHLPVIHSRTTAWLPPELFS